MSIKQRTGGVGFRIDKIEVRSDGAREVSGYLTKTGVFEYTRDGETVRELRSEEEVFSEASLDSLQGSFVTVDHPGDFLAVDSWREDAVGVVSHVQQEPPYVAGKMRIWDSDTIQRIESGLLKEVSCGYTCIPMPTERADADVMQTNLRFNHVAIGPDSWGRLGSDVSLRLDSNGQEVITPFEALKDNEMSAEQAERLDALETKLTGIAEAIEALAKPVEPEPTEDASPIHKEPVLPDSEHIDSMVREQAEELLSVELRARDAAQEILGWRWDAKRSQHVRSETYRVDPVLCARRLVEDVLRTVDSDVNIEDGADLTPYVNQAELLAKQARTARLSTLQSEDSIRKQLTGAPAHLLETKKSRIRFPGVRNEG